MTWASSSATDNLPSLGVLQTWVHRPQALAKCTISDLYTMKALVKGNAGAVSVGYTSRDVFMLNRFPCRMVEIVGWVSGVDEKEKTQTVYLDDGDGTHILPVTVRLPLITTNNSGTTKLQFQTQTQTQVQTQTQTHKYFIPAKERKALRKAALLERSQVQPHLQSQKSTVVKKKEKEYARNDIRVGDTVRVKGRIDEWRRGSEMVRQVVVEPGSGGFIEVVDSDQQYLHLNQVIDLHETLYSKPFDMATSSIPTPIPLPLPISSAQVQVSIIGTGTREEDTTFGSLYSTMVSSEITSEMSVDYDQVKLCIPSKLRASQLTDRTFRLYLLDHISQETIRALDEITAQGDDILAQALESTFPEYRSLLKSGNHQTQTQSRRTPFQSRLVNNSDQDQDSTPRPKSFLSKSQSQSFDMNPHTIQGYTIPSILSVPHLGELAGLVVDEQSRKEEKRRRRRVRDGLATPKDLAQQSQGGGGGGWKLTKQERGARMERLVKWVIRGLSEEGSLVQVKVRVKTGAKHDLVVDSANTNPSFQTPSKTPYRMEEGYIPLPEPLLFPLLIPHLRAESEFRQKIYIKKTDVRYGNGILLEEVLGRMRRFGEDGRWERLGEGCVEDALVWGDGGGLVSKVGRGWVLVE